MSYALDAQWSGRPGARIPRDERRAARGRERAPSRAASALSSRSRASSRRARRSSSRTHPALAAAVAWIPGRNDSLLAVFALAAWLLFLRDRERLPVGDGPRAALRLLLAGAADEGDRGGLAARLDGPRGALLERDRGPRERRARAVVYVAGWGSPGRRDPPRPRLPRPGRRGRGALRTSARTLRVLAASPRQDRLPVQPLRILAVPEDLSPWPGGLAAVGLGRRRAARAGGAGSAWSPLGLTAFGSWLLAPVLAMPGTLVLDNRLYLPACGVLLAVAEIVRAAACERPEPAAARLLVGAHGRRAGRRARRRHSRPTKGPSATGARSHAKPSPALPTRPLARLLASGRRTRSTATTTARSPNTEPHFRSAPARSCTTIVAVISHEERPVARGGARAPRRARDQTQGTRALTRTSRSSSAGRSRRRESRAAAQRAWSSRRRVTSSKIHRRSGEIRRRR